jgi:NAD(P)-dependent dehydrogenase (short-subunit alcohol dehydrogenase family)
MSEQKQKTQDPREMEQKGPFPKQSQPQPGSDEQLQPKADHGEQSYQGHGRLRDKVAVITGGDSGIGRAVAIAFAREGADVTIAHLMEEEDAQITQHWVEQAGRRGLSIAGDIGDESHCQEIIRQTLAKFGRIDILVNNAAYQESFKSLEDISAEKLDHTFRSNIYSMFFLCKAAVPHMEPGSAIINTASVQAYMPSPALLPYATTKGAIVTFTKGLALELIKQGIRVNAVAPGPVWTPLIPVSMPPEHVAEFGQDNPTGRPAQPAELAHLYVLLASPVEGSYLNGGVYDATGGKPTA